MQIAGKLTISRVHSNTGEYIEIRFHDDDASVDFATAKLELADFATAVTGLGYVDCEIGVHKLERVGKLMEHKSIEFPMPESTYDDRKEVAAKAAELVLSGELHPGGWVLSDSFNSQGSFFKKDGQEFARAIVRRWV